jgi:hypothetical protein
MCQLSNPYWDTIRGLVSNTGSIPRAYNHLRWEYCNRYCWSIPDPETVAFVARYLAPRAIEIGAGTGYWSWLLAQHGIDILAYDSAPPDCVTTNEWHSPWNEQTASFLGQLRPTFHPIEHGGPEQLLHATDRSLFLCWPPYKQDMALQCLTCYTGHRLVYVGEDRGGCCANNVFFDRLKKSWLEVDSHWPVQWYNIGDKAVVYERKRKGKR